MNPVQTMTQLLYSNEVAQVETRLCQAWEFLSGETRRFECLMGQTDLLQFAEFSFFMPLTGQGHGKYGGVGVLIQYEDAVSVAANMFGVARQQVQECDLRDACAETCNVFADCMATHFNGDEKFSIGLPRAANPLEYENIAENSVARVLYQGVSGARKLFVVLYDTLGPSS